MVSNRSSYFTQSGEGVPLVSGTHVGGTLNRRPMLILHAPRAVRVASVVSDIAESRYYEPRKYEMWGKNLPLVSRYVEEYHPEVAVVVVGSSTAVERANEFAELIRSWAKKGMQVFVAILNRVDPADPDLSAKNRRPFIALANEWIECGEAHGWAERLVVFNAGGPFEVSLRLTHYLPNHSPLFESVRPEEGQRIRLLRPISAADRIGLASRLARECEHASFSIERLYLKVEDQQAVGVVAGSFDPDCSDEKIQGLVDKLERLFPTKGSLPHVGHSREQAERFAKSRFGARRRIHAERIPNVPGRLQALLSPLAGPAGGANVVSVACETHTVGRHSVQNVSIVAEVGFLPPEERVRIYTALHALREFSGGVKVDPYRGPVHELERSFLR